MRKFAFLLVFALASCTSTSGPNAAEVARWKQEAADVTIVRDNWGIAHVHGKTDADAVFGMEYAQAEDDFNRVEMNYLDALGRMSEAEGPSQIYRDLRMKLFVPEDSAKAQYARSPEWLKKLMDAFADGLNYYLYTHPDVHPKAIHHFEPWMALAFTEGSIGGDITTVSVRGVKAFYSEQQASDTAGQQASAASGQQASATEDLGDGPPPEPSGSNGIAIAPKNTLDHHALLWINPHTSFYFRSELQMSSDQGLDAYGAVTWGQFFIYQGFNRTAGWMHTSSGVDNIDQFLETIVKKDGRYYYRHGKDLLPVRTRTIVVHYKAADGTMAQKTFTGYYTMHGPVVAKVGDKWMTTSLMYRPIDALIQDFTRTKAKDYAAFKKTMELHTNSSNNTIFADAEGNIAYFHSDYIPRRDTAFDWTKPVDGSNPATDYHGILTLAQTPHLLNPADGWLYNSNNWPWSAAGPDSPKRKDFPRYVERGTEETARGFHALRVLPHHEDWTMLSLTAAAFDSYLPAFAMTIPTLVRAYDRLPASDPLRAKLAKQMTILRGWNYRWGYNSVATSLAVFWGTQVMRRARADHAPRAMFRNYVNQDLKPHELVEAMAAASDRLTADFGNWRMPWGDINRFQRLDDSIQPHFDDSKPSIPVPFTSSLWGSLASFGARPYPNTKKWYGNSGNSFVAVVQFGDSIRARAVTAGGESGNPKSPHFDDEAERYATGNLRTVYFYPSQLVGHTERTYHPGG